MTPEEAEAIGYCPARLLPTGKIAGVMRMIHTFGLVVDIDEEGNGGRYCYNNFAEATLALADWDGTGDPPGPWLKAKIAGKEDRRGPGLAVKTTEEKEAGA